MTPVVMIVKIYIDNVSFIFTYLGFKTKSFAWQLFCIKQREMQKWNKSLHKCSNTNDCNQLWYRLMMMMIETNVKQSQLYSKHNQSSPEMNVES